MEVATLHSDIQTLTDKDTLLERYQQIIEAAGDVIYLIDKEGIFTYVNARVQRMLGYAPEDVIGQHFTRFIAPDWREEVLAFYARQLKGKIGETILEFPALTRANEELWVEQTVQCFFEKGEISGFQAIVRDISARKRTENELNMRLEQLAVLQRVDIELMQNLDIGYILAMALDQTVRLGRADCGFIGLMQDDNQLVMAQAIGNYPQTDCAPYGDPETGIIGQSLQRRTPIMVTDVAATHYHTVIADMQAQIAIPLMSRDRIVGVLCLETRYPERFTSQMLEFIQLITTRIAAAIDNARLYAAVQRQLTEMHELYSLKMRFVSMVSHEFRTPLATILCANNNFHDYYDRMTPEQRLKHLIKIQTQIDHMTNILDDVLVIGHMESGAIPFAPAPLDLNALCLEIIDEFRMHTTKTHPIHYLSEGCCQDVVLDEKLMRQIITNLLSNAAKYSPAEQPIDLSLVHDGTQIILSVHDAGIGIPEVDHGRLFEPFHRAANVGAIAGTGLGLAITKYATELHGGKITFESQPGAGATFTVSIPQTKEKTKIL